MSEEEVKILLKEPINATYAEWSLIGSSCQHIHQEVFNDDTYLLVLHMITLLSASVNILAMYAIVDRSSSSMGNFKWCLANLQFWIVFTDMLVTVLIVPRFYFPMIGGRTLGVLFQWGLNVPKLIFIGFGSFGCMVASVAVLFIYRHQVIIPSSSFWKLSKEALAALVSLNYLIYMNATIPALYSAPTDQLQQKIEILKIERCPPKNILDPRMFLVQTNFVLLPYLVFLVTFVGTECGLLAFHSSWCLFFSTLLQKLSKKTRKMQIKFMFALIAQIAIPTAFCYAPIFYCTITTFVDHYNQFANDICVFVFVTHGMVSSICLLLFYDCYREFLFSLIFKNRCCSSYLPRKNTLVRSEPVSLVKSVKVTFVV